MADYHTRSARLDMRESPREPIADHRRPLRGDLFGGLRPAFDEWPLQLALPGEQYPVARFASDVRATKSQTIPAQSDRSSWMANRAAVSSATALRATDAFLHKSRTPLRLAIFRPEPEQHDLFGNECEGMCGV